MSELTNRDALPFIYTVNVTLAANGTAQTTLIMQADSYFELHAILGTGGQNNTTEDSLVNPNNFSVSIRDQTTGNELMSQRVPQRILCGNAFNAFIQRRPIVFEPQSNLFFDFLNLTANTNVVTLGLHGYKIKL